MTDEIWRPLGIEDNESVRTYEALHDGVPEWMSASFWAWVRGRLVRAERTSIGYGGGSTKYYWSADKEREIERVLRFSVGYYGYNVDNGLAKLQSAAE